VSSTSSSRKPAKIEKISTPPGGKVVNISTKKVSSISISKKKPANNGKLSTPSGSRVMEDSGGNRYKEILSVLNEALEPVDWEKLNISGSPPSLFSSTVFMWL